ncbi:hypothetical protein, partial [Bacillus anthracis]|uniref:hypothetical protein n=1 Tax=Bacillus anthracis TaxID=1392 RepID=UPI000E12E7A2
VQPFGIFFNNKKRDVNTAEIKVFIYKFCFYDKEEKIIWCNKRKKGFFNENLFSFLKKNFFFLFFFFLFFYFFFFFFFVFLFFKKIKKKKKKKKKKKNSE